jgi:Monooxygenase subunit B protein
MKERYINGEAAPAAFMLDVGAVYDFKMVMEGRTPGYWHLHPTLYVLHTGGLIGPGQWTTVTEVPGWRRGHRPRSLRVQVGLLVLVPRFRSRRLVDALVDAQASDRQQSGRDEPDPGQRPGEDIGLITKADHRMSTIIVVVTLLILGFGWLYMEKAWPIRIPQQVLRITPPELPESPKFAQGRGLIATYDPQKDTLVLDTQVTNTGNQPMRLVNFTTSNLTFTEGKELVAEPATVPPGQTVKLRVSVADKVWSNERLIPLNKPQMGVAGLLVFEADGKRSTVTTEAPVKPTSFVVR